MLTIYKNFGYDNKYDYIKGFTDSSARSSYFNSLEQVSFDDVNYIKDHESFIIDIPYETMLLQGYNYISFRNDSKTIYAFITRKEYVNDNATRINYEIDVMTTFHFDFDIAQSFIERKNCTISEITDFDEGLSLGEHEIVATSTPINKDGRFFALISQIKDFELVMDENGKIIDYVDLPFSQLAPMTKVDGIQYPMYFVPLADGTLPQALEGHPSLISIVRFPECTYTVSTGLTVPRISKTETGYTVIRDSVVTAITITSADKTGTAMEVPKASVTDFFPYTYYVLTDGETEPLIMKPQDLPSSITVVGKYALSHQPIERYFVNGYKGDTTGRVYNITNVNQMALPTATNQGMAQLQANAGMMSLQRKGAVTSNILSGVSSVVGAVAGIATGNIGSAISGIANSAGNITSGLQNIKEGDRRAKDMMLTPDSISSLGTPSSRSAFSTNNVRVLKYSVSNAVKTKINNFHSRFGHKFHNYGALHPKTYRGYIKYIEPNIRGKIDNMFVDKIKSILERGVYIE